MSTSRRISVMAKTQVLDYDALFDDLVESAVNRLKWIMTNSDDERTVVRIAQDLLDRAGASKKTAEQEQGTQVIIRDSDVKLLIQAAREALPTGGGT